MIDPLNETAEPFPVGEYIQEAMETHGLSLPALAHRMGGDPSVNYLAVELLLENTDNPNMMLGQETADGLARVFGTSADLWLNLDRVWRNTMLRRN